jgi:hypothetical protein
VLRLAPRPLDTVCLSEALDVTTDGAETPQAGVVGEGAAGWREMVDELKDGRGRYSEVTPFEACDTRRHTTLPADVWKICERQGSITLY